MKRIAAATVTVLATIALAVFTGVALAGNGNGNGNGGTPPGQAKQDQPPPPPPPAPGVKPSNTTEHDTNAPTGSNQTKLYGNGKTAGQIAEQHGASASTNLHGPGNSQPHKVAPCPGGHEVDVHALKAHSGDCAQEKSKSKPQSKSQSHAVVKATEHVNHPETPAPSPAANFHVTICHATGSSTNPYVRISPDAEGVINGHLGHQGGRDIVPPFTFNGQTYSENWPSGQTIFNNGCAVSAPPPASSSANAAPAAQAPTQTTPPPPPAPTAPPAAPTTPPAAPAAPPPATTPSSSGVLGATHAAKPAAAKHVAKAPKPAVAKKTPSSSTGVLGTSKTAAPAAPKSSTGILGSTLPFTGLPLWIVFVAALGLIIAGGLARTLARGQ